MLDKEKIEFLYKELGKRIRKHFKGLDVSIYVVGGANLTVMTNFRETTHDIDVIKQRSIDLRDIILEMEEAYSLEHNWLNDSVMFSNSFSMNLRRYVGIEKKYGPLRVCYIQLVAVCAMKLRANRPERSDLDDALLICSESKDIDVLDVELCYADLYKEELSTELKSMLIQFKELTSLSNTSPKELLEEITIKYPECSLPEAIERYYLLRKQHE